MNTTFSILNAYGDHMVLQQDKPIRIVGTAPSGMEVVVRMSGASICREAKAVAAKDGFWRVVFDPLKAGGPYEITAANRHGAVLRLRDVMIGEVWFLGGQSNMQFPLCGEKHFSLPNGKEIAAAAHDPLLRFIRMPLVVSPDSPCENIPSGTCWETATSAEAVGPLSAIGYLFGQRLRKRLGVPVGLIHSNWGGCRIEPWIDEDTLRRHHFDMELSQIEAARFQKTLDKRVARAILKRHAEAHAKWLCQFRASNPAATKQALETWPQPATLSHAGWCPVRLRDAAIKGAAFPGVIWYRTPLSIPGSRKPKGAELRFASLNDCAEIFWDGKSIGKTDVLEENYWALERRFPLSGEQLAPGEHLLCIRLENHFGAGAISKPELLCANWRIDLDESDWEERVEFRPAFKIGPRPIIPQLALPNGWTRLENTVPATLFNAMFYPFKDQFFRGALWYQGCANASEYSRYARLHRALVESWRRATGNPDMVFLAVELAGSMQNSPDNRLPDDFWKGGEPSESIFPYMRVEQEKIRSVRGCEIASAVDVGDHSDIHPTNKAEVARRLEALAAKMCYGAKDVGPATGPRATGAIREGAAIRVSFENVGKGLELRGGDTFGEHAWAICGRDWKWLWAVARLDGDTVVVSSPEVPAPVAVRYAWDSYPPNMRLWNRDGFPAFPVAPLRAK